MRGFARYLAGIDPATEIPPRGLLPDRRHWRPPFIYTPADIDPLLTEALGADPGQPMVSPVRDIIKG